MTPRPLSRDELLSQLESACEAQAVAESQILHRMGRVRALLEEPTPSGALRLWGRVQGARRRPYAAEVIVEADGYRATCDCGLNRPLCPHALALARAWASTGAGEGGAVSGSWRAVLDALAPRRPAGGPEPGQEALVHWVELARRGAGAWTLRLSWLVHRPGARGLGAGRPFQPLAAGHGVPPECAGEADLRVIALALSGGARPAAGFPGAVDVASDRVDPVLRALARAPWVRWSEGREAPVFDLRPLAPRLRVLDRGSELALEVEWPEELPPGGVRVVGSSPPWLEAGGVLRPVEGVEDGAALTALCEEPLLVSEADLPAFLGTTVPNLEERGVHLALGSLDGRRLVAEGAASPRLYLAEEAGLLVAELRFGYGDFEVAAENPAPVLSLGSRDARVMLRRDMEAEFRASTRLRELGFRVTEPGRFEIEGDAAFDFLLERLEALAAEWEVFGRDRLRRHRVLSAPAALGVRVSAGIDWLDLHVEASAGGEDVAVEEVLKAFRRGSRYVRLGSGAHARLPGEWLERVGAALDELGPLRGENRLEPFLAPLVDGLLAEADRVEVTTAEAWERLAAGLRYSGAVPDVPVPKGFGGVLRPYQIKGYQWLRFLGEAGLGGVLADDMGLGKTVQTLALLLSELESGRGGPNLVVAPTSVVANWEVEAGRFAPQLKVLRYHGPDRRSLLGEIEKSQLVLTSYALLRRDGRELGAVAWNYVILDEAQAIKNASTQTARASRRLGARRRLALTGTPLENHLGELWSQFHFLMPGLLGTERRFTERYARPASQGDDDARERLSRRIRPFVLRRLKGEVEQDLPEKVESVLRCQMGPEQERLYRSLLAASRERVFREVATRGLARSRLCILDALLRLRQACCLPEILPGDLGLGVPSAKFDLFCDFVGEVVEEGHRVLVFSQFVSVLEALRRWFEGAGISHLYLDGSTRDRQARVRRFQEDETVKAFLVSLKAGGTGLNLTGADYVLLYDPWWNPAVEAQATDRAHRIGQTRKVFAYKLITEGTVEEKILALQERKRGLTEQVLRTEAQWGRELSEEDVAELFGP